MQSGLRELVSYVVLGVELHDIMKRGTYLVQYMEMILYLRGLGVISSGSRVIYRVGVRLRSVLYWVQGRRMIKR